MQTMFTLDTYHRNCPLLLTKVREALKKSPSWCSSVSFMFSLHLWIFPQGQATKVKPFPLMSLLPKHNMSQYYRYYGSLTTPPCSQAVIWTLYEVPIYISWSQVSPSSFRWCFLLWKGRKPLFSFLFSWLSLPRRSSPQRRMPSRWHRSRTISGTSIPPSVASSQLP